MSKRGLFKLAATAALVPLGMLLAAGGGNLNEAKEKAKLIEQGQLNLRDATAMAEKHIKGTALEVSCKIEQASPGPKGREPTNPVPKGSEPSGGMMQQDPPAGPRDKPPLPPPADREKETGKRLVYLVSCFAQDRIQEVKVDGLAKKVIEDARESAGTERPK